VHAHGRGGGGGGGGGGGVAVHRRLYCRRRRAAAVAPGPCADGAKHLADAVHHRVPRAHLAAVVRVWGAAEEVGAVAAAVAEDGGRVDRCRGRPLLPPRAARAAAARRAGAAAEPAAVLGAAAVAGEPLLVYLLTNQAQLIALQHLHAVPRQAGTLPASGVQ
jgi:hypothetical protein